MELTNQEQAGRAMELLRSGIATYAARQFINRYKGRSARVLQDVLEEPVRDPKRHFQQMDVAALLRVMWRSWNEVYRHGLGRAERSLVSELREFRNRWAHQEEFSDDDTYRALDSAHRLVVAVSSPVAADIEELKRRLCRDRFEGKGKSAAGPQGRDSQARPSPLAPDGGQGRAADFVVNVDKPTGRALVHRSTCRYYTGRVAKRPEDGGWSEPYRTKEEALSYARRTGLSTVREAGCCNR